MQVELSPEEQLVERIRAAVGGGTDREIAAELGVSPASITNWKRGEGPGRKRLKQIAEKYNVSLDHLQYGNKSFVEEPASDDDSEMTLERFTRELRALGVEDAHSIKSTKGLSPSDMKEILATARMSAQVTAQAMIELRTKGRKI